jgi:hypothetical protein
MADGLFYNDLRTPFVTGDVPSVTLANTAKALYPPANFPVLGGQYWSFVGKRLKIRLFGRLTTAATPGNGTFAIYYGNGADATGTILASSAAFALTASQAAISWELQTSIHCRSIGATGTLFCTGRAIFNPLVVASTIDPVMIPGSTPVASASLDLTAANIISVQFSRSGSTAEAMQVHDMEVVAMN